MSIVERSPFWSGPTLRESADPNATCYGGGGAGSRRLYANCPARGSLANPGKVDIWLHRKLKLEQNPRGGISMRTIAELVRLDPIEAAEKVLEAHRERTEWRREVLGS